MEKAFEGQPVPKALYDPEEEDADEKLAILSSELYFLNCCFFNTTGQARDWRTEKNLAQPRGEPGRYTRGTRVEIGKKSAKAMKASPYS